MWNEIIDYFLSKPQRLCNAGLLLFKTGAWLGITGLLGRLATTAGNSVTSLLGPNAQKVELADLFPGIPLWWVPESMAGAMGCLALIGLGLFLNHVGKTFSRYINA